MIIHLLDGSLRLTIYYCEDEVDFEDNICVEIEEDCPKEEKLLQADHIVISVTPQEARQLAKAFDLAADASLKDRETQASGNDDE